jgi:hypothetical protein
MKRRLSILILAIGGTVAAALSTSASAEAIDVAVPGIPGPYCAYGAQKRLLEIPGVLKVEIRWKEEIMRVVTDAQTAVSPQAVLDAFKRADYPLKYELVQR